MSRVIYLMGALVLSAVCSTATIHAGPMTALSIMQMGAASQTTQFDPEMVKALLDGVAKAWRLTSEGYTLMGGFPSLSSKKIAVDQLPAAWQKFIQSEQVLDQSEPTAKYPHDRFPIMYAHSDYVRASNLHGLGMIIFFKGDMASAEQYLLRSLDLTESAFKNSKEMMSYPQWAENARECALLAGELHSLFAFFAVMKDDNDSHAKHRQRLKELAAWAEANPR